MKSIIKYDENTNSLIINDGSNSIMMHFIMILNILNVVIRMFKKNIDNFEFYIWIFIGLISISILFYNYLKIDTSKEIKVDNIECLKIKKIFGKERFLLLLKNGKKRNLVVKENTLNLKNLIIEIGIKTIIK